DEAAPMVTLDTLASAAPAGSASATLGLGPSPTELISELDWGPVEKPVWAPSPREAPGEMDVVARAPWETVPFQVEIFLSSLRCAIECQMARSDADSDNEPGDDDADIGTGQEGAEQEVTGKGREDRSNDEMVNGKGLEDNGADDVTTQRPCGRPSSRGIGKASEVQTTGSESAGAGRAALGDRGGCFDASEP
ncbi:unnamed protein product, partial [Prorocentrum cordatum]